MVKKKIYVRKNYHEITLGSATHFAQTHSEPDGSGGLLFYIIGDDEDAAFVLKHGLAREASTSVEAVEVPKEPVKDEGVGDVAYSNEKYLETGDLPEKYFCKDHNDHHARGETEYYTCLDKFRSNLWSSDEESPPPEEDKVEEPATEVEKPEADKVEEGIEESPQEPVDDSPPAPVPDLSTHGMSVAKAMNLIEAMKDFTALNMLKDGEGQNPEFPGGRKGILNAIHKRIQSLSSSS